MRQLDLIVALILIVGLLVWNFVMLYKLATFEDKLKQKEYQMKIRETRANQKVREAEQVIKDNTIYLEDIN